MNSSASHRDNIDRAIAHSSTKIDTADTIMRIPPSADVHNHALHHRTGTTTTRPPANLITYHMVLSQNGSGRNVHQTCLRHVCGATSALPCRRVNAAEESQSMMADVHHWLAVAV